MPFSEPKLFYSCKERDFLPSFLLDFFFQFELIEAVFFDSRLSPRMPIFSYPPPVEGPLCLQMPHCCDSHCYSSFLIWSWGLSVESGHKPRYTLSRRALTEGKLGSSVSFRWDTFAGKTKMYETEMYYLQIPERLGALTGGWQEDWRWQGAQPVDGEWKGVKLVGLCLY